MTALPRQQRKTLVDLNGHHATCEMNFHQLVSLLPGIKQGVECWHFCAGNQEAGFKVSVCVIDDAPYTTTVAVEQVHANLSTPKIVVRLYHDVNMAEIVSWDHHRYWLPNYPYPNPKMYHPDEKLALNRFLNEWLSFCRNQGLSVGKTVIQFS